MSEADVATRAPESDAAEDAAPGPVPGPAPIGRTGLSDHCVSDRPAPKGRSPKGEMRRLGDVDAYVSKPREYPHAPARLLLLLSGGTGVRSTNNQIQADMFADEGYVVVMPDLFGGDVAPNATTEASAEEQQQQQQQQQSEVPSFLDLFRSKAVETVKSFMIDMWLARHTEAKVLPIVRRVLEASRDEFADAVASGDGVYAAGYCFGGRYVLLLAGDKGEGDVDLERQEARGPLIRAGAVAHATLVSPDDFQGLQAPISLACVETDPMFPDEVRMAGEKYLSGHDIEHEVQVYPGVPHGFAVVGDYDNEAYKRAQEMAFGQMLRWLNDH
ncbi:dienelactone hydrolase family protein [Grosmannia clavigera kw1407]|uniref:Dienelactone hydrolase family protein n=1 Tax=Grosmannia clavigera (strain kw1407 / UAMH 11150) TaxID=655863 RepID=F0XFB1_GROCL|nr:dienelactone hydrolase family protein [Grosmannia clavigera kw1407]EFX04337.1 dienelactone hydrolase family protein [Grosmannia clavigera kw1407]